MAVFRVTIFGTTAGQMTNNVLHFEKPDAVQADMLLLASKIDSLMLNAELKNLSTSAQKYNRIHVAVPGSTWIPIDRVVNYTGIWASTIQYTPVLCYVFQLRTGFAGKHGRGRFYVGGVSQADMNEGLWGSSTQTRLNTCAANLMLQWVGAAPTSGFNMVVCPRNDTSFNHHVELIIARPMVGVQRRRNLGVGS